MAARALAAWTRPLWPIDVPPAAATGQACQGTPAGAVATETCSVGTFQLTSPTSVEPPVLSWPSSGCRRVSMPFSGTPADFCRARAKASSSAL